MKIKLSLSEKKEMELAHDFRYKKSKLVPAKADSALQKKFIKTYMVLLEEMTRKRVSQYFFIDAVYPAMATKVNEVWIL